MQEVLIREAVDLQGHEVWFDRGVISSPVLDVKLREIPGVIWTMKHQIPPAPCIVVYLDPRCDKGEVLAAIKSAAEGRK